MLRNETEPDNGALLAVHRNVIATLGNRNWPSSTQSRRLHELQQERIYLVAQIEATRQTSMICTIADSLKSRKRRLDKEVNRPYLSTEDRRFIDPTLGKVLHDHDLAQRMQKIRKQRKITAAYRLAGITLTSTEDETLVLRLDIPVQGRYTACYHVFFDLVLLCEDDKNEGQENDLYLRLIQHTLPNAIPLTSILQYTLGGFARVGPYQNEELWDTRELESKLRNCANQLYQACFCFETKKHAYQWLESLTQATANDDQRTYFVENLQPTVTFHEISFHLKLLSSTCTLHIELTYRDPTSTLPTIVYAKNSSAVVNHNPFVETVSDDEEGALDELAESAMIAFRRSDIKKAVLDTARAMEDW